MRRRNALRRIRLTAPSLLVLAGLAVLVVVLVNDGSSTGACPTGQSAAVHQAAHCRHPGASAAVNGTHANGGTSDGVSGVSGAKGHAYSARAGHAAGSTGTSGSAGVVAGSTPGTAGGSAQPKAGGPAASPGAPGGSASAPGTGYIRYGETPAALEGVASGAAGGGSSKGGSTRGMLASGHSESGTWSTESQLETELEPWVTAATITLPARLGLPLFKKEVTYIPFAETGEPGTQRSDATKAACGESGTVAAPTANPGHLCVYAGAEDLHDRNPSGKSLSFVDAEFFGIIKNDGETGIDTTGFRIAFGVPDIRTAEEKAHDAYPHIAARGSWVLTAP